MAQPTADRAQHGTTAGQHTGSFSAERTKHTENRELTPEEKARAAQAHYARERRKNPEVRAREQERKTRYWANYFDKHLAAGGEQHE